MCAHHPTIDVPQVTCFACYVGVWQRPMLRRAALAGVGFQVRPALTPAQIAHRARMLQHLAHVHDADGLARDWPAACNGHAHATAAGGHTRP